MTNYLIAMATFGAIYAILALGLNVMWGMAGMVNLGIVGFYALRRLHLGAAHREGARADRARLRRRDGRHRRDGARW